MVKDFKLTTDAPNYICIESSTPTVAVEFLGGEQIDDRKVHIPFTQAHANKIREYLRGKTVDINVKDRTILAWLADQPDNILKDTTWTTELIDLQGIKLEKKLAKVANQWDLIHYLPARYIDTTRPQSIRDLVVGDWAVIVGIVAEEPTYNYENNFVKIVIEDRTGTRIAATFFRQQWLMNQFKKDSPAILYGKYSEYVAKNRGNAVYPQITNPKINRIETMREGEMRMIPVYPQKKQDTTLKLQRAQDEMLKHIAWIEDPIPDEALTKYNLMHRNKAYRQVHFPTSMEELEQAQKRVAFDEFIRLQMFLHNRREDSVTNNKSTPVTERGWAEQFINALPFSLTDSQTKVIEEILEDMKTGTPMYRLLQGDVGSGKAQPYKSRILTPEGWRTMADMHVGDRVSTPNGKTAMVIGTFPQGMRPVYELHFSDRTKVQADENHLWRVCLLNEQTFELKTTAELIKIYENPHDKFKLCVEKVFVEPDNTANVVNTKTITSIKYVGKKQTKCIKLDTLEGLYITDGNTVTHNTEVSSVATLAAAQAGQQVALLAPTDILAQQLFERLTKTFRKADLTELEGRVVLLKSKSRIKEKRETKEKIANGEALIAVGTHALLQKDVTFNNLGLTIVDEQHKFGVAQRDTLRAKQANGTVPDFLSMSATPIPRATAQIVYGDMDISILDQLPEGRIPIETHWLEEPDLAWAKTREEVEKGNQAYVVAALVEDSEKLENIESATATYIDLSNRVFPDMTIGLMHGKLSPEEKANVLNSFKEGRTQILVATTVVEVGINVPQATVMTILNANRFGIASLHQIRGRVGRSTLASYCYLVGEATLPEAEERLNALVASNNGFWLAEKDLEIRGEGSLFGQLQSGDSDMVVGNLREHRDQLDLAKKVLKFAKSSKSLKTEVETLYKDKTIQA